MWCKINNIVSLSHEGTKFFDEFNFCAIPKHMVANFFVVNAFFYEIWLPFFFNFLVDSFAEKKSWQFAWCLEHFTFIQAVVAEELDVWFPVGYWCLSQILELFFQTTILMGQRVVNQHHGVFLAVEDSLLKVFTNDFDGMFFVSWFGCKEEQRALIFLTLVDEVG